MPTPQNGIGKYTLSQIDDMYTESIIAQFDILERLEEVQANPHHQSIKIADLKKDLEDSKAWCVKIDSARNLKK